MNNRVQHQIILPYTPEQIFALVADIEHYPEFVPGCVLAEVVRKSEAQKAGYSEWIEGRLVFGKGAARYELVTHNQHYPYQRIDLSLVKGSVSKLSGYWQLSAGNPCTLALVLDIDFDNFLVRKIAMAAMNRIFALMTEAFEKRAQQVYG